MEMKELNEKLVSYTGTEQYWGHFSGGNFTDGIKAMAELVGGFWLIDMVMSHQMEKSVKDEEFQVWILTVKDNTGLLIMKVDTDEPILVKEEIDYTLFPEGTFSFYFIGGVMLLKSEY